MCRSLIAPLGHTLDNFRLYNNFSAQIILQTCVFKYLGEVKEIHQVSIQRRFYFYKLEHAMYT